jgi:4-amino-4-deoxy-L-arabinose transferase-like glycosyltransferase
MNVELALAAFGWFVLAFGHTTIGVRWVLPSLTKADLPGTPFGPPAMTRNMLRFTWYVVSMVQVGFGILLAVLALAPHADTKTLLLRWLAAFLLAGTALAVWNVRRRPRSLLRLPVPLVFVVIAGLCLAASG